MANLGAASVAMLLCFLPLGLSAQDSVGASSAKKANAVGHKTTSKSDAVSGKKIASRRSTTGQLHSLSRASGPTHKKSLIAARNGKPTHKGATKSVAKRTKARGQQKIDPERAQSIQEALIREHYLTGEPAGTWNQASEDAMRRYQADHGWQSKTVPDSRALISLGLGPSHDHLLNPESAMTGGPVAANTASVSPSTQMPVSHSARSAAPANAMPTSDSAIIPTASGPQ
jgi:hypothetical protein